MTPVPLISYEMGYPIFSQNLCANKDREYLRRLQGTLRALP